MLMMKIQLDTEKLTAEKRYAPASVAAALDSACAQLELRKVSTADGMLTYCDSGREQDYARFGKLVNTLKKQPWFMENVSRWLFYDGESDDPAACGEEDLLLHYRRKAG